jgi:dihydroxyacetone kinase-like predicted kinase
MAASISSVKTGQVTFAARDSQFDGHDIKEGQVLGMLEGELKVIGEELSKVVLDLIGAMQDPGSEILTLYYGADVTKAEAEEILRQIGEAFGDRFEITLIDGGQPVYYMILAVE